MHAIIERTANFVCKQGAQFEIMLKAKQARNSQFDFLRFDHYLNPYYKFIQKAMKEGRYAAPSEKKKEEKGKWLFWCGIWMYGNSKLLHFSLNQFDSWESCSLIPIANL